MAGVGGGGGGQPNVPPPGVFAKVAVRYAPLVLPVPLHDLPDNYIKNLPKFTGEGDLTAAEHINFLTSSQTSVVLSTRMSIRDYLSRPSKDRSELGFRVFLQLLFGHMTPWKMLSSDNGESEKITYITLPSLGP
jgi:hypothetical protein